MDNDKQVAVCALCGEPMPLGEEMFVYHGYSGDCPKPPLPLKKAASWSIATQAAAKEALARIYVYIVLAGKQPMIPKNVKLCRKEIEMMRKLIRQEEDHE